MENLVFSLNATVPIFLLMIIGYLFHYFKIMNDDFIDYLNKFVFNVALPVSLFDNLAAENFYQLFDFSFVIFCFLTTFISIFLVIIIGFLFVDKRIRGEFVQVSYRSSAALLGVAFITNIYGQAHSVSLMIIGSVPLYNIMAVVVLAMMHPSKEKIDKALLQDTFISILKNPIIIAIFIGLSYSLLRLPYPAIMQSTVKKIGSLATPLGLMAMGGSLNFTAMKAKIKPVLGASLIKLIGLTALFLPLALALGFRHDKLMAILIMLGSASTVSCFIMAKNMNHEGTLTASVVMVTTVCCAFTLTFWIFVVKSWGFI